MLITLQIMGFLSPPLKGLVFTAILRLKQLCSSVIEGNTYACIAPGMRFYDDGKVVIISSIYQLNIFQVPGL